jgi:hypothetical protein
MNSVEVQPDFSQPGDDGVSLPEGFNPWGWSVVHTVRPELLVQLAHGKEYVITVRILRRASEHDSGYTALYERAQSLAHTRISRLTCGSEDFLHHRILNYGWTTNDAMKVASLWIAFGVVALKETDDRPSGKQAPAPEDLANPRHDTAADETMQPNRVHEIYTDADLRDAGSTSRTFLFSYGEYVSSRDAIYYAPYVKRAEHAEQLHLPFLAPAEINHQVKTTRREWFCATNPDIAVVHVYLEVGS